MKLTNRGFTLVELMIVIAIIGILAAALFPSLTSYLARGRDTSRASALKEISTAIAAYIVDNTALPASTNGAAAGASDCASSGALTKQLPKFPKDPSNSSLNCGTAGLYGYGTGNYNGTDTAVLSAKFENELGGNTGTSLQTFQGMNLGSATLGGIDSMTTGSGSGYVIRN